VHYTHIVTGDDGHTHLRDVELPGALAADEAGVPPLLVSEALPVDRVEFVVVRADEQRPGWHNAPRRQLVVFLTGWVRIEVSDGEVRTLPAGSVVLADDLTGPGHVTTHEGGDQRVLVIPLDPA
jgi:quercetin dioxygenase-like cupin family protein